MKKYCFTKDVDLGNGIRLTGRNGEPLSEKNKGYIYIPEDGHRKENRTHGTHKNLDIVEDVKVDKNK